MAQPDAPRKASLIDQLTPDRSEIKKTQFVEWFDGDALEIIWTQEDIFGSGTVSMADGANNGLNILTGATTDDRTGITFNGFRHYSNTGSVCHVVCQRTDPTSNLTGGGLNVASPDLGTSAFNGIAAFDSTGVTNKALRTGDGTITTVESSIASDQLFTNYRIDMTSTTGKLSINGILEVQTANDLPTAQMEPFFQSFTAGGGAKNNRIRYLEAYNT